MKTNPAPHTRGRSPPYLSPHPSPALTLTLTLTTLAVTVTLTLAASPSQAEIFVMDKEGPPEGFSADQRVVVLLGSAEAVTMANHQILDTLQVAPALSLSPSLFTHPAKTLPVERASRPASRPNPSEARAADGCDTPLGGPSLGWPLPAPVLSCVLSRPHHHRPPRAWVSHPPPGEWRQAWAGAATSAARRTTSTTPSAPACDIMSCSPSEAGKATVAEARGGGSGKRKRRPCHAESHNEMRALELQTRRMVRRVRVTAVLRFW